MDNKNIIIIVLVIVFIVLSMCMVYSNLFLSHNQNNQPINSTNNTTSSVNVEKIAQEDEKSNSASNNGIHRAHLIGGDVAVNGNGIVVGHFKTNGEYAEGGQLAGMTIEEARAFDERASKQGLT